MANGVKRRILRLLVLLWLVASSSVAARQNGDRTPAFDERALGVRALIDNGQLALAETEAERLFQTTNAETSPLSTATAGDLLVEAYVRNGRGAEARTRQLAERVARTNAALLGS